MGYGFSDPFEYEYEYRCTEYEYGPGYVFLKILGLKMVAMVVLVLSIAVLVLVLVLVLDSIRSSDTPVVRWISRVSIDTNRFTSHVPRPLDSSSIASNTRNAAIDRVLADLFRQAIS